ncbi:MAG TPA: alkaline phosphatase family protein [Mycobacteriales bacterium]|nr:alkaline phosphatase family protein [Mycobacteriales bacterium]
MKLRTIAAAAAAVGALTAAIAAPAGASSAAPARHHPFSLHRINHVFVIVEENEGFATSFGAGSGYLAHTLPRKGLLLTNYYATGHASNDNYIAMVSGQAPNTLNQTDCILFANFAAAVTVPGTPHQQLGPGCVYPSSIGEIGRQLTAHGLSWKAYQEDMGNLPSREARRCGHPAVGSRDQTQSAVKGDGYATRHDPFVYFHEVIDHPSYCNRHVVPLGSPGGAGLAHDLRHVRTTPNYVFITPNLCHDGHDYPCHNQPSGASRRADIDAFLRTWVPRIRRSPAFRKDGLLEITFDESEQSDAAACCGESLDVNAVDGLAGIAGRGGGRIGALLLSPFVKPGTRSTHPYNHYSTLATDEAIFGLPRLGYATTAEPFAGSLFRR